MISREFFRLCRPNNWNTCPKTSARTACLAVFAGLRASELRGLRWSDIDFTKGTITVAQSCRSLWRNRQPQERDIRPDDAVAELSGRLGDEVDQAAW
jgi:integrase